MKLNWYEMFIELKLVFNDILTVCLVYGHVLECSWIKYLKWIAAQWYDRTVKYTTCLSMFYSILGLNISWNETADEWCCNESVLSVWSCFRLCPWRTWMLVMMVLVGWAVNTTSSTRQSGAGSSWETVCISSRSHQPQWKAMPNLSSVG